MFVPGFVGQQLHLMNVFFFLIHHVKSVFTVKTHSCVCAKNAPLCHYLAVWIKKKKKRLVHLLKLIYQSACLQRALLVVLADKCRGEGGGRGRGVSLGLDPSSSQECRQVPLQKCWRQKWPWIKNSQFIAKNDEQIGCVVRQIDSKAQLRHIHYSKTIITVWEQCLSIASLSKWTLSLCVLQLL